ncbi:MAG: hypothetical protein RIQ94_3512 [Pseudomonadota bacterium]
MRTLIVSQYFWPESFRINDVAKTLVEKGVDQQEIHEGAQIHRIPFFPRGNSAWRLGLNYLSFIIASLFFAPWMLRKKKFDVIFVYAPSPILQAIPAIFLGWLKGCPVVLWVQDLWPESLSATGYVQNRWVLKLVEQVVRFIYRHVDLLLVQSRAFEGPVRVSR